MRTGLLQSSRVRATLANTLYLTILYLLLTYGNATSPSAGTTSPSIQKVMAGNLPRPGTDAYWAINPQNPDQKILLVPSAHVLNLRYVDPVLAEAIKKSTILVVENLGAKNISWDDATLIKGALPPLDLLKKAGAVRPEPFLRNGTAWTRHLTPDALEFLRNNLEPSLNPLLEEFKRTNKELFPAILNKFPIDNLNPNLVLKILTTAAMRKFVNIGMDRQIMRYFELNNRTILGLETTEELEGPMTVEKVKSLAYPPSGELTSEEFAEIGDTIREMKVLGQAPPLAQTQEIQQHIEREMEKFQKKLPGTQYSLRKNKPRNELWIPRLEQYFNQYKNESIVVVVGAAHFNGPTGIIKLLANKGLTFKPFE